MTRHLERDWLNLIMGSAVWLVVVVLIVIPALLWIRFKERP
jgi:hypothetical protein